MAGIKIFFGEVVGEKTWSSTQVSSSGGGGFVGQHGGYVHAPRVHSSVSVHEQFFVRGESGEERPVETSNGGRVGVRIGHHVSLVYHGSTLSGVYVHETGSCTSITQPLWKPFGIACLLPCILLTLPTAQQFPSLQIGWLIIMGAGALALLRAEFRVARVLSELRHGPATPERRNQLARSGGNRISWLMVAAGVALALQAVAPDFHLPALSASAAATTSSEAVVSGPGRLLSRFRARLSPADHVNSRGIRLQSAAAVIIQDRSNYYNKLAHDEEDEPDFLLNTREERTRYQKLLERGLTGGTRERILNAAPVVEIELYEQAAEVKLAD